MRIFRSFDSRAGIGNGTVHDDGLQFMLLINRFLCQFRRGRLKLVGRIDSGALCRDLRHDPAHVKPFLTKARMNSVCKKTIWPFKINLFHNSRPPYGQAGTFGNPQSSSKPK